MPSSTSRATWSRSMAAVSSVMPAWTRRRSAGHRSVVGLVAEEMHLRIRAASGLVRDEEGVGLVGHVAAELVHLGRPAHFLRVRRGQRLGPRAPPLVTRLQHSLGGFAGRAVRRYPDLGAVPVADVRQPAV